MKKKITIFILLLLVIYQNGVSHHSALVFRIRVLQSSGPARRDGSHAPRESFEQRLNVPNLRFDWPANQSRRNAVIASEAPRTHFRYRELCVQSRAGQENLGTENLRISSTIYRGAFVERASPRCCAAPFERRNRMARRQLLRLRRKRKQGLRPTLPPTPIQCFPSFAPPFQPRYPIEQRTIIIHFQNFETTKRICDQFAVLRKTDFTRLFHTSFIRWHFLFLFLCYKQW